MKIVVNTPNGHIGRSVTQQLLNLGEDVVVISRQADKVAHFVDVGAKLVQGSIDEPAVLDEAFAAADGLFWLTPPALDRPDFLVWAKQTGQAAAESAKRHGIQRIVVISSIGAQHEHGLGPIGCMGAIETAFSTAAPSVTVLRAGSFMENYLMSVGTLASVSTIFGPYPADRKMPVVATRDIADKAVEHLRNTTETGFRKVGVHGPQDLSPGEAAAIIGEGIGRSVRYVEVSVDQAKQAMIQNGLPPQAADLLGEMYTGFLQGLGASEEPRTPETTTPTTLLTFARDVIKPMVDSAAAGTGQ